MSLVLLLATLASFVEPVVGQARDGEVHHRTELRQADPGAAAVAVEDARPPGDRSESPPGPNHDHGTQVDHCTHEHSAALVPSLSFALRARMSVLPLPRLSLEFGRFPGRLFHPPRA